ILSTGFARVARGEMPKAPVPAAAVALDDARLSISDIDVIKTHNPFAVNDLWFARETGADADAMNPYGCSLIYGHPQGPTGARGLIELMWALHERGGGRGLFTGCAAGDTGAAVVIELALLRGAFRRVTARGTGGTVPRTALASIWNELHERWMST